MSAGSDQKVQCPVCLQMVDLKLLQSTHLDNDCPGLPSNPAVVAVSDLLPATKSDVKRRGRQLGPEPGEFLSEDRWAKRKAIAASTQSLLSPGLRNLGSSRLRKASYADDKALDAIFNNSLDHSALDSLKLMVSCGIDLPPEPFNCVLFEILNKDVSLRMSVSCYVAATELLRMDPLIWVPLDIQCQRFWEIFIEAIGNADQFVEKNDLVMFRKSMLFVSLFILAFHVDIRQRKSEGLDCRGAILRKQIEMAAAKKKVAADTFIEELNQVYFLAQIAIANDLSSPIPKRFRVEALGLAEAFQRLMNNCFPNL